MHTLQEDYYNYKGLSKCVPGRFHYSDFADDYVENMSRLLQCILGLIHIIYGTYLAISSQWLWIQGQLFARLTSKSLIYDDDDFNEYEIRRIKKLPQHLVMVIDCEDISFRDLVKIISWTVSLGITHLTFYDQHGIIKENSNKLKRDFVKLWPNLVSRVNWEFDKTKPINYTENGFKINTAINFLSYENGKHEIIKITKELSHAVAQGLVETEVININLLNEKLQINYPEPDLAIVCSRTFSTFGLLPWHIRITEFFHLSTHHNFSPKDFLNVLEKYGNCQQRYGK